MNTSQKKIIKLDDSIDELVIAFDDVRSSNGSFYQYNYPEFHKLADKFNLTDFIKALAEQGAQVDYDDSIEFDHDSMIKDLRCTYFNVFILESDTTIYVILDSEDFEDYSIDFLKAACTPLKIDKQPQQISNTKKSSDQLSNGLDSFNKPLFKNF